MQQQKRPTVGQAGKPCEAKENKLPLRKPNKVKQIKSKIFKNISQLPIDIHLDFKENQHNQHHPNRPHSSLIHQQHHLKPYRLDSALSHYPDHRQHNNRKRLSLDSTGKKYERDSLISKNSVSKKMSRNTKSIEQSLKLRFAEERRKSNVSCRSIHQQNKIGKKQSLKLKRPSVSSLHQGNLPKQKDREKEREREKENRQPKQHHKLGQKSRSKSKKVKRKNTVQLDKSKASTTVIANFEKANLKKKQSNSTAYIGVTALPKKKKKNTKKKSEAIDLSNAVQEPSMEEYPISKYDIWTKPKPDPKRLSAKRRSKSGKGSASKDRKKPTSMVQIDYVSCINIPSNSSGLIESKQSNSSSQRNSKIKILDNWQYNYLGEENTQSVNLEEIRYYQSYHYSHKKEEDEFIKKNFRDKAKYYHRSFIQQEIAEDYPHFEEIELKFLASVVFIQRKWRENRLYRQIFEQIAHSPHKISQLSLEKSNSKQLNISHTHKSPEKQAAQSKNNQQRYNSLAMDSIQQSQSSEYIQKVQYAQKASENLNQEQPLKNNAYLQEFHSEHQAEREFRFGRMKEEMLEVEQDPRSDQRNLTTRSQKYYFLGNELFPSMSYIRVKEQQLKEELYNQICQFNELQRMGTIEGKEYQKLRALCQQKYQRELRTLNKSRKDIKKGYLSIIDSCKNIKQTDGLRRVSSDHGPMALLYMRIFNLESSIKTPSQSSQSMKRLTKRVLIRKQFFQTHKIEPNIINATLQSTLSARQNYKNQQQSSLSARIFKKKEFQSQAELKQINEIQELQIKRIREGFILSPQIKMREAQGSPLQKHAQKQPLILQEVIATLTHQLFCQLMKIDERRENVVDILQEGHDSNRNRIKGSEIKDFQIVEESSSLDFQEEVNQEDFQIVQESKLRQIYKIEGLSDKLEPEKSRKHRKSNTYNISPASLEPVKFQEDQIMAYGRQLFDYLKHIHIEGELVAKLNKNQGFSPIEYLRFLRDFQIPDEEYEPLISNQVFMQWQQYYENKTSSHHQQEGYLKRQASAVFHRCIFECLIGFLQEFRPCGEKGEPFPWQNVFHFKRTLQLANTQGLYLQSLAKLQHTIKLKCGIIDQKQVIFSQLDMERVHQENQDKIIFMLEEELSLSHHNWYEIEQHCLQVKLQVEAELFEYIMLEALDQLLELF